LLEVWRKANRRYFSTLRERLQTDLANPDAPYDYSWNYPLARYFAIQLYDRWSPDRSWALFEGKTSVRDVVADLGLAAS